jgi:oligopeptide transport system ATP-binding protein
MAEVTLYYICMALLFLQNVSIGFPRPTGGWVTAVNQVDLCVNPGEFVGLVGESGSGKSLTCAATMGLIPSPGKLIEGTIHFNSIDMTHATAHMWQAVRGKQIALIPQDPMTALNPVYTIGFQLAEVMMHHLGCTQAQAWQKAAELLDRVKLPNARRRLADYPHQFSGGMRQRVMIAMALSCSPQLLIADEPTTALDVTVQAQVLDLLKEIQQDTQMAIVFITHDLGVVAEVCDRVAVMYAGRIVEKAPVNALFAKPHHPYTQGLMACMPLLRLNHTLTPIPGQPPTPGHWPSGCSFHPRCVHAVSLCKESSPPWQTVAAADHQYRCIL